MKDAKKICVSKMGMLKEHKKLIPMLKKGGFKAEAKEQTKEMKKYK